MGCHRLGVMDNWSDTIRALEARNWTLTGIAKAIGRSVQAVSDLKQGRTVAPTGMAAIKLHHLYSTGAKPQHTNDS